MVAKQTEKTNLQDSR